MIGALERTAECRRGMLIVWLETAVHAPKRRTGDPASCKKQATCSIYSIRVSHIYNLCLPLSAPLASLPRDTISASYSPFISCIRFLFFRPLSGWLKALLRSRMFIGVVILLLSCSCTQQAWPDVHWNRVQYRALWSNDHPGLPVFQHVPEVSSPFGDGAES